MTVTRRPFALAFIASLLTGCAGLPSLSDTASGWAGEYQSQPEMGLITHLSLQDDHSATTTYRYTNGDPSLEETGQWQTVSATQLQVKMTSHHGLTSSRIYTFTPELQQLTAHEETVNGQTYTLGGKGLVLIKQ